MKKVLITGASGLIGTTLTNFLSKNNFEVIKLSRSNKNNSHNTFTWDIESGIIEKNALINIDCVIHLAGAGIGDKRWTSKRKKEITDSREKSAKLLYNEISRLDKKPKIFISASAIGYYGAVTSDKILTENDPPGNDFQGKVCKLWESSSNQFEELGMQTVQLRFGVVLSRKGGALEKMSIPIKLGIGSPFGTGKQFIPWIHLNDVLNIILFCIENENVYGPYNAVSPTFVTNREFLQTLANVLRKPFFMPNVPTFLLKLLLGQMSEIVLEGSRISSQKIIDTGFKFNFKNLENALQDLFEM